MESNIEQGVGQAQHFINMAWGFLPNAISFLVIIIIGWMVAGWVRKLIVAACLKGNFDPSLGKFLGSLARWFVLIIAGMAALSKFGVETAGLAAIIASAGIAVGLALQGTLSNFAAGVMLLIFRPFKVGDYIAVAGKEGHVEDIDLFTTRIDTLDHRRIIIPNGQVFGAVIENQSYHPARRCDVNVAIDGGEDIVKTRAALEAATKAVTSADKSIAPQVVLVEFAPGAMNWQVRTWAKPSDYFTVLEETVKEVHNHLAKAGIHNPTPVMNVTVTSK
jgi:small conductance mechanosensitive channel